MTKEIFCPCCESAMKVVTITEPYPEYKCSACDHIHFENTIGVSAGDYEQSEKYQDYYTGTPPSLWYHKKALKILKQSCSASRVLDFGCYDGFFVRAMRDQGLDAFGCDWNRDAIANGKGKFSLEAHLSRDPEGMYDAIVALEVIEHFSDPRDFFKAIIPHLAPDGVIVLSCPNKNAFYRPGTDCPPHHFSRFSTTSLRQIVEQHGFTVIKQQAEMSSFQMLRNFVGDKMRRQHAFQATESSKNPERGKSYQILRRAANATSSAAQVALTPVDLALHAAGVRYLAQVIWARKT